MLDRRRYARGGSSFAKNDTWSIKARNRPETSWSTHGDQPFVFRVAAAKKATTAELMLGRPAQRIKPFIDA
jgi:hypothetical protein